MSKILPRLLLAAVTGFSWAGYAADKTPSSPEAGSRTNAQNYKDMVLAICLAEAYKNASESVKDIGSSAGALREWAHYDWEKNPDQVNFLVTNYLKRNYFNPLVESEVKGVRFDFLKCLDLYHSKALDSLVKSVVINPTHTYQQDNP